MKSYSFAPISAREYPTVKILDNPYIWGGVQFCVNLSEKPYTPELVSALAAHGIEWIHCPVSEEPGADWLESFAVALPKMYRAYKDGKSRLSTVIWATTGASPLLRPCTLPSSGKNLMNHTRVLTTTLSIIVSKVICPILERWNAEFGR